MSAARAADFQVSVASGPRPERITGPTTETRCNGCRRWYLKRLGTCPDCGTQPPEFLKSLRAAQLNAHTMASVEAASK